MTNFFLESKRLKSRKVESGLFESITNAVASNELYLDSNINVETLAKSLGYKTRDLSEIVNSESGGTFYEFINGFRVEKAKSLLHSEQERRTSIEAIALLCGFKSRSSFYEYFRRVTGKSPGEYRNLQ
jgi:transcriptional regulator GlxA family with amidase domain